MWAFCLQIYSFSNQRYCEFALLRDFLILISLLKLDIWCYNAFSNYNMNRLDNHLQRLHSVQALKRGKQFENFSNGEMYGVGFRMPMGGCPGSAYSVYEGMEATTLYGLEALFDHAEVLFHKLYI